MAFYVISVRQTGDLPVVSLFPHPASFRFHLAMDTLTFGYILPTTGRIRDLHPLETCAAGRTPIKKNGNSNISAGIPVFISYSILVSVHTSHFIDVKLICRGEIEFDRKLYIIRKRLLL